MAFMRCVIIYYFYLFLIKIKYVFLCKKNMFKSNIYILFVLIIFFTSGLSIAQNSFNINGRVFYNGEVAAGVSVVLIPNKVEVNTNKEGIYTFENLNSGEYILDIKINGLTEQKNVFLNKSENVDFYLEDKYELLEVVNINVEKERTDDFIKSQYSAMPVVTIDKRTIELMGSRRLDEVLKEQTGMAIVNNIGGGTRSVGIQMQGFGSEYIMVLIDGQPLVGRNSGDLDLSRISVSSIERIEIIKGVSSSLYGSEALGGTINIITKVGAVDPQLLTSVNYGTFNIVDATVEGEIPLNEKGSLYAGVNYYRTDGFNTNTKYIKGVTSPPYD